MKAVAWSNIYLSFVAAFTVAFFSALPTRVRADPAPLDKKPWLRGQAEFVMPWYIEMERADAAARISEMTERLNRLQGGGEIERDPYDRGASVADFNANFLHDFKTMLSHFYQCAEPKPIGICWDPTPPVDFGLFWEYYLPKQKVEAVDQPFKSGYFLESMQQLFLSQLDNPNSPASHYFHAPKEVVAGIKNVANIADDFGERWFGYQAPDRTDLSSLEKNSEAIERLRDLFDRDTRFRSPTGKTRFQEYHVMPTYFEEMADILAPMLFWFPRYHTRLNVGYWASDWPFTKIQATFARYSYLPFPVEMLELYGIPGSGKFAFPLACTGYNMRKAMTNPGAGYVWQTPADMLLQLPDPKGFNPRLWLSPGQGCLGFNQGNWVPVTTLIQQPYSPPASAVAAVKGIKTASAYAPFAFYTLRFKDSEQHKDKFQWSRSDKVRGETGGACMNPEQFLTVYGDALQRGDPVKDHADWDVIIHWPKFRVCPPGMTPLVAWSGGTMTRYR